MLTPPWLGAAWRAWLRPDVRIVLFTDTYADDVNGVARTLARLVEHGTERGHEGGEARLLVFHIEVDLLVLRLLGEREERGQQPRRRIDVELTHDPVQLGCGEKVDCHGRYSSWSETGMGPSSGTRLFGLLIRPASW